MGAMFPLIVTFAVILLLLCGLWVCFGMFTEDDPSDFTIEEATERSPLRGESAKKSSSVSTYEACNGVLSLVPRAIPKPAFTAFSVLMQTPENLEKITHQPEDLNSSYFQTLTIRRNNVDEYSNKQTIAKQMQSIYPTNSPVQKKDTKIKISDEITSKVPTKVV